MCSKLYLPEDINNWVSPGLDIRFKVTADNLEIYYPHGGKFLTSVEFQRVEQEKQRADQEHKNYQDLLAKLAAKGIDLNNL